MVISFKSNNNLPNYTEKSKKDNTVKYASSIGAAAGVIGSVFSVNKQIKLNEMTADAYESLKSVSPEERLNVLETLHPKVYKIVEAASKAQEYASKIVGKMFKDIDSEEFKQMGEILNIKEAIKTTEGLDYHINNTRNAVNLMKSNKTKLIAMSAVIPGLMGAALGAGIGLLVKVIKSNSQSV